MPSLAAQAFRSGLLKQRRDLALNILSSCSLCPRSCGVNRLNDETGFCRTGRRARVASYGPHFGEESFFVGDRGSGTIFFGYCNLNCVFCQNYDISHAPNPVDAGEELTPRELAAIMLELQEQGCHNINFVTPTHVVPQILEALTIATAEGLNLPLIYNCGGYEKVETLQLLDGIIDIYMPDFKFWKAESGRRYMAAPDYPEQARSALQEMQRQVGTLTKDEQGLATGGLHIRHLLMPGCQEESRAILRFIAEQISPLTSVNIMGQYHPCGRAREFPELNKEISGNELQEMQNYGAALGLQQSGDPDLSRLLARLLKD